MRSRAVLSLPFILAACASSEDPCNSWLTWGARADHGGSSCARGQGMKRALAEIPIDPFVEQEQANDEGEILVHYQAPLLTGDDAYLESKGGTYTPCLQPIPPDTTATCAPYRWNSEERQIRRFTWSDGQLGEKWTFTSDWKPEPTGGFQPAFQSALCGDSLFVPGAGGSLFQVDRGSGAVKTRHQPFGATLDPDLYVAGPVTTDGECNAYYTALKLDHDNPWGKDAGGWLVRVSSSGSTDYVDFATLTAGTAPGPGDRCVSSFNPDTVPRPWPPAPNADGSPVLPDSFPCGSERPGIGAGPAIGPDGTIFVISRAHFSSRNAFVVAVTPDLKPKWAASMRDRLNDACGHIIPSDGDERNNRFHCRPGAIDGVEPSTNLPPAGRVIDDSSSSPVALPDGGVLYGAFTSYNGSRGHLFSFDASGQFVASYGFGWDTTPSLWKHDDTYSIILKDNHYGEDANGVDLGPFFIVQLNSKLKMEWQFLSTNTKSCRRGPSGELDCVENHPNGFEWCVNAAAVDKNGVVYVNSEDGNVYAIEQGGHERSRYFLEMAVGAAYTPLALDGAGRIYTMNGGKLLVLGD